MLFSNLNVDVTAKTLVPTWLAIGDIRTGIRKAIGSRYVSATHIPTGKTNRVCRSLLGRGLAGAKTTVATIDMLQLSACVTWAVEQLGEGGMGGP